MAYRPSPAGCYFGAESCAKGHTPDCPMVGMILNRRRFEDFFGDRDSAARPTPMPSGEEDTLPIHRTATAAPAWSPHYGGFIMGGQVV